MNWKRKVVSRHVLKGHNKSFYYVVPPTAVFYDLILILSSIHSNRYRVNRDVLREGMKHLGFREPLPRNLQGHIITSYRYPDHRAFNFEVFYNLLNEMGMCGPILSLLIKFADGF